MQLAGHASELTLQDNGSFHPLAIDLTIEVQIAELAIDRLRHGVARDAEIAGAEICPLCAIVRGIPIAAPTPAKHGRDEIAVMLQRLVVCDRDGPLHPGDDFPFVEAEPHLEVSGLLADGDMRLRNDRSIESALRQQREDFRITRAQTYDGHVRLGIETVVPKHLAHVPVAAAPPAQHTQLGAMEVRPGRHLRMRDEILHGPAPHAAADDLESGPFVHRGQCRRRAEFADLETARIELGGDLGASEYNPES